MARVRSGPIRIQAIFPALALALTISRSTFLAMGCADAFDPRMRGHAIG